MAAGGAGRAFRDWFRPIRFIDSWKIWERGRQAAEICFLLAVNSTGEMHPKRRCCVSYIFFIFSGIVKENCVCTLALRAELLPEASILGTNTRRRAVRTADVQTDDPIIISSFKCCSWILRTPDNWRSPKQIKLSSREEEKAPSAQQHAGGGKSPKNCQVVVSWYVCMYTAADERWSLPALQKSKWENMLKTLEGKNISYHFFFLNCNQMVLRNIKRGEILRPSGNV